MSARTDYMPLQRVGDLHLMPSDVKKIVCAPEFLIRLSEGEMLEMIESLQSELSYRESKND